MAKIMSVNAGSSSLKFQLFQMPEEEVLRITYENAKKLYRIED
jgi:acetate kinase